MNWAELVRGLKEYISKKSVFWIMSFILVVSYLIEKNTSSERISSILEEFDFVRLAFIFWVSLVAILLLMALIDNRQRIAKRFTLRNQALECFRLLNELGVESLSIFIDSFYSQSEMQFSCNERFFNSELENLYNELLDKDLIKQVGYNKYTGNYKIIRRLNEVVHGGRLIVTIDSDRRIHIRVK